MFAVQCSFCQHDNVPGARFCAECGSPLHLKVCPNAKCGKVSDVNASRCETCGTAFPKIELADSGASGNAVASGADDKSSAAVDSHDAAAGSKPAMAAWPLIIVAVVAGGLPLLWVNRSLLPAPKTWQTQPEATRPAPPAPVPTAAPPAPEQAAQADGAAPAEHATASNRVTKDAEEKVASRKKAQTRREDGSRKGKPSAEAAQRPCTEAVAALGLCKPGQPVK